MNSVMSNMASYPFPNSQTSLGNYNPRGYMAAAGPAGAASMAQRTPASFAIQELLGLGGMGGMGMGNPAQHYHPHHAPHQFLAACSEPNSLAPAGGSYSGPCQNFSPATPGQPGTLQTSAPSEHDLYNPGWRAQGGLLAPTHLGRDEPGPGTGAVPPRGMGMIPGELSPGGQESKVHHYMPSCSPPGES